MVWNDGTNTCGNPAPVIDEETGTIHLLMTWNHGSDGISQINDGTSRDTRRVFACQSTDDGLNWSTPKEITSTTKLSTWGWYATGPCHGIQLTKGANKGRLVIPCDYISLRSAGGVGGAHVIYSDDKGATWQLGGYTTRGNESTVAELSDGKLLLNIRISNNNNFRVSSTSSDAGITWTAPQNTNLVDPVCQGSLVSGTIANGQFVVFFSNPSSSQRENMTVKMSLDNGATWSKTYSVYTGLAGYSDLVFLSNTHLGILYEAGKSAYHDGIAYRKIAISNF
jgi:sialidase-1